MAYSDIFDLNDDLIHNHCEFLNLEKFHFSIHLSPIFFEYFDTIQILEIPFRIEVMAFRMIPTQS